MIYRITRVAVHQTSKTLAVVYFFLGFVYIPFMFLANFGSAPDEQIPAIVIWLMPVFLAVLTYVAIALVSAVYNAVAKWVGGVELTFTARD